MNRLFEESVGLSTPSGEEAPLAAWSPAVDILESEDAYILRAELPGVEFKDLDLQVQDNMLVLKGDRKFDRETKRENYHRVERTYGSFYRSFTLPSTVDQSKIKAKLKDGVLEVVLPKMEQNRSKTVPIEVKTS
jgi:HSP20 family protein